MSKCTCAFPCGGTEDSCPSSPSYGVEEPKVVFSKDYDGESIVDLGRDISEAFDERFNPAIVGIPEMEDSPGFWAGNFKVTIQWTKE